MGDIETESPDLSKTKCCGMCCPMTWRKKKPVESQQSTTDAISHKSTEPNREAEACANKKYSMLGYFDFSDVLFAFCNALLSAFQEIMTAKIANKDVPSDSKKQNPAFVGDLPKPLLPGHCIRVTGKPQNNCERFSINFKCSNDENSDILFHFNPRLAENYIVRNSRHNGKWQKEETESLLRPNLIRNYSFTFSFFIAPTEFMVSINGHHFCVFSFRMPLIKANIVEVEGNVDVDEVEVTEATSYPTEDLPPKIPFEDVYKTAIALPNPFIGHLDKGFKTGWQLEIYGKVKMLPHSFYINLQKGSFLWPHPIIPLHLNPRFNASTLTRVLIRNSWEKNEWGAEERSPGFYFMPSKPFHLIIQLDLERELFIVWVDGKLQGEFRVRNMYNAKQIDTVYIEGDLTIYKVFMKASLTVNRNEL